ncbi:T9SS type B sorting domain-containing protein [Winogradskyella vidalii]|uniref:T9SS type B sorting domain-containing protein n=1 Tax=Winogradskyella vidalii TaxID=2615024 RepID=UPI001FE3A238|nr:gliding motility-associated C-terminal domain-containing protein [Winogradskyella vidalii]
MNYSFLLSTLVLILNGNFFIDNASSTNYRTESIACPAPIINTFSPSTGPTNTEITINGSNFNETTTVDFNGINASFTLINNTEITVIVPPGIANTTPITLTTSGGCNTTTTTNFSLLNSDCNSADEIYISEVYDSDGGSYGVIELYNPTNTAINLNSTYEVQRFGDIGNALPSATIPLEGSIAPLSTYIIEMGNNGNTCSGLTAGIFVAAGINEDDEIKLLKDGAIIDVMHTDDEIGFSFIRNADASAPSSTFNLNEWLLFEDEDCSNLGLHTADTGFTPNMTHPTNQNICENATATFSVAIDTGSYSYQWLVLNNSGNWVNLNNDSNYSGVTTNTLTITNAPASFNGFQYYCIITSGSCDFISNTAQLVVSNPEVDTLANQTVCFNYTLPELTNGNYYTGTNGTGTPLSAGTVISASQTIYIYNSAGTSPNTCQNESSFTVSISGNPQVSVIADQTVCSEYVLPNINNGNYFTAPDGNGTLLNAGDTILNSQTVYIFNTVGVAPNSCTNESSFEVVIYPSSDFTLTASNINIEDDSITILMSDASIVYEYAIDNSSFQSENTFTNISEGAHTLYVQDANGCLMKSIDFEIETLATELIIPRGFSPNNDNTNDWFNIQGLYNVYTNHKLEIYNRYGTLIFEGNNTNKWYGIANKGLMNTNNVLPVGTYFYVLYLNEPHTDSKPFTGWVYLNK